jgi:hypothetical protein
MMHPRLQVDLRNLKNVWLTQIVLRVTVVCLENADISAASSLTKICITDFCSTLKLLKRREPKWNGSRG